MTFGYPQSFIYLILFLLLGFTVVIVESQSFINIPDWSSIAQSIYSASPALKSYLYAFENRLQTLQQLTASQPDADLFIGIPDTPPTIDSAQYFSVNNSDYDRASFGDFWNVSNASLVDDGPFDTIPLPFNFPYFHDVESSASISPNGVLHFSGSYPCIHDGAFSFSSFSFQFQCDIDTNYFHAILLSLTDYFPLIIQPASIIYSSRSSYVFLLQYSNISLFYFDPATENPPPVKHSFRAALFQSGRITVQYQYISDPAWVPHWGNPYDNTLNRDWLVGLRTQTNIPLITENRKDWENTTSRNGIYPPRGELRTGRTLHYFPFQDQLCYLPDVASPQGGTPLKLFVSNWQQSVDSSFDILYSCQFRYRNGDPYASATPAYLIQQSNFPRFFLCIIPPYDNSIPAADNRTIEVLLMDMGERVPFTNRILLQYAIDDTNQPLRLDALMLPSILNITNQTTLSILPSIVSYITRLSNADPSLNDTALLRRATPVSSPALSLSYPFIEAFCSSCSAIFNGFCTRDCAGTLHGTAEVNDCGVCTQGTTGKRLYDARDCEGVCFGPFALDSDGFCQCADQQRCANLTNSVRAQPLFDSYTASHYVFSFKSLSASSRVTGLEHEREPDINDLNGWIESDVSQSLDIPLQKIGLPFIFPYFADPACGSNTSSFNSSGTCDNVNAMPIGMIVNAVYLSPNGVIYLDIPRADQMAECLLNGSSSFLTINRTPYCAKAAIAGILTAYDISENSHVYYYINSNAFSAYYQSAIRYPIGLPTKLFNSTSNSTTIIPAPMSELRSSYQITLFASGRIVIRYFNVTDGSQLPMRNGRQRPWISGLLTSALTVPDSLDSPFALTTSIEPLRSSSIRAADRAGIFALGLEAAYHNVTRTSTSISRSFGLFPERSQLPISGSLFYTPIPLSVCHSPRHSPASGGVLVRLTMRLRCCTELLNLSCIFDHKAVKATYNVSINAFECIAPAGQPNSTILFYLAHDGRRLTSNKMFFSYDDNRSLTSLDQSMDRFCTDCVGFNPAYCTKDCHGDFRGSAFYDGCGQCVEGLTGKKKDFLKDCNGVCLGPFQFNNNTSTCGCSDFDPICFRPPMEFNASTPIASTQYVYEIMNTEPLWSTSISSWTGVFGTGQTLQYIKLPFIFNLYSIPYSELYIASNGALYFERPSDLCITSLGMFMDRSITTSRCLQPFIAGLYTYFNQSLIGSVSAIRYSIMSNALQVEYSSMILSFVSAENPISVSFSIRLDSSGAIWLAYKSIIDLSSISLSSSSFASYTRRPWLVGLYRGFLMDSLMPFPWNTSFTPYFYNNIDKVPIDGFTSQLQWLSDNSPNLSGIFPSMNSLITNTGSKGWLTFCPISPSYCIYPNFGSAQGGGRVLILLNGASCLKSLSVHCSFGGSLSVAVYNATYNSLQCIAPPGVPDTRVYLRLLIKNPISGVISVIGSNDSATSIYHFRPLANPIPSDENLCRSCSQYLNGYCRQDCYGIYGGSASLDSCGVCSGPRTGRIPNADKDCEGLCFGPFRWKNQSIDNPFTSGCQCNNLYAGAYTGAWLCSYYQRSTGPISLYSTLYVFSGYEYTMCVLASTGIVLFFLSRLFPRSRLSPVHFR